MGLAGGPAGASSHGGESGEAAGLRVYLALILVAVLLFSASYVSELSEVASDVEDERNALLLLRLARQRVERAKQSKLLKDAAAAALAKSSLKPPQRERDASVPNWVTPRSGTKKYVRHKKDEAWIEDDAEQELRVLMVGWLRSATSGLLALDESNANDGASAPGSSSSSLERLRKRQQLVEEQIEAVVDHSRDPAMPPEMGGPSSSGWTDHSGASTGGTGTGSSGSSTRVRGVGGSVSGPASSSEAAKRFKSLRAVNYYYTTAFSSSSASWNRLLAEHLQALGYASAAQRTPLPLWVLGAGRPCDAVDPQSSFVSGQQQQQQLSPSALHVAEARHVFWCARYISTGAGGGSNVPRHVFSRPAKTVFQEIGGEALLIEALSEAYDPASWAVSPSYRLSSAQGRAKLETALAREPDAHPVYVVEPGDGSEWFLTDSPQTLLAQHKKHEAKQLTLRPLTGVDAPRPALWDGRLVALRSYVIFVDADPLMALYAEGPALRSPVLFAGYKAVGVAAHDLFPMGDRWEAVPVSGLGGAGLELSREAIEALKARMRQIAAYVVVSAVSSPGGVRGAAATSPGRVYAQHLCLDFALSAEATVSLLSVKTECGLAGAPLNLLFQHALAVAEEHVVRKSRREPTSLATYDSYPDAALAGLVSLIDEARERAAGGRTVLNALSDLIPPSAATPSSLDEEMRRVLEQCPTPRVASFRGTSFASFVAQTPVCSSFELPELFSLELTVGSGDVVDDNAFSPDVERALQACLSALQTGDWVRAARDCRRAGYGLCRRRVFQGSATLVFQPLVRGAAALALQAFTCGGSTVSGPTRALVEIPHPFFDHTRQEGMDLFDEPGSMRALLLSGTHRCAQAKPSGCTGNVGRPVRTNCPGREEYTDGDAAHSTRHTFHALHVLLSSMFDEDAIVSLHSTKQLEFVVSDGTSHGVDNSSRVARFVKAVQSEFRPIGRGVESCNAFAGSPNRGEGLKEEEKDVCGATNIQGRHLNGAESPCQAKVAQDGSPLVSSGRFVHVEQPVDLVKDVEALSEAVRRMGRALKQAFGAPPVAR